MSNYPFAEIEHEIASEIDQEMAPETNPDINEEHMNVPEEYMFHAPPDLLENPTETLHDEPSLLLMFTEEKPNELLSLDPNFLSLDPCENALGGTLGNEVSMDDASHIGVPFFHNGMLHGCEETDKVLIPIEEESVGPSSAIADFGIDTDAISPTNSMRTESAKIFPISEVDSNNIKTFLEMLNHNYDRALDNLSELTTSINEDILNQILSMESTEGTKRKRADNHLANLSRLLKRIPKMIIKNTALKLSKNKDPQTILENYAKVFAQFVKICEIHKPAHELGKCFIDFLILVIPKEKIQKIMRWLEANSRFPPDVLHYMNKSFRTRTQKSLKALQKLAKKNEAFRIIVKCILKIAVTKGRELKFTISQLKKIIARPKPSSNTT